MTKLRHSGNKKIIETLSKLDKEAHAIFAYECCLLRKILRPNKYGPGEKAFTTSRRTVTQIPPSLLAEGSRGGREHRVTFPWRVDVAQPRYYGHAACETILISYASCVNKSVYVDLPRNCQTPDVIVPTDLLDGI